MSHQPVLLQESLAGLAIKPDGIYVDGTFGRGGHSQGILQQLNDAGRLLVIDKDPEAIAHAKQSLGQDKRVSIFQGSFAEMEKFCHEVDLHGKINGILLDLGVSSPQLDNAQRGFSFLNLGLLDMRMDLTQEMTAATFINQAKSEEMAQIFRTYGEEKYAKRIANAIVKARLTNPIETTLQLAEIIKAANPNWEKHKHPATRVFQAIRIYINQELTDLTQFFTQALNILALRGRLAIISFHSLEDRIVKQFMRNQQESEKLPKSIPVYAHQIVKTFQRLGKAIKPTEEEIKRNSRARSAVLRVGEKIA